MFRIALKTESTPPEEVFFGDERHLLHAYTRHTACARVLLDKDGMLEEAEYHTLMAAECILKHLFCLLRCALGLKANVPADFGDLRLSKNLGHDMKALAVILVDNDTELRSYVPLSAMIGLLPAGKGWNDARYRAAAPSATRPQRLREILALADQIHREGLGGTHV